MTGHWIAKDTVLVQLGDVTDRGPDACFVYFYLDYLKKESFGNVIQLLGNHEVRLILLLLYNLILTYLNT